MHPLLHFKAAEKRQQKYRGEDFIAFLECICVKQYVKSWWSPEWMDIAAILQGHVKDQMAHTHGNDKVQRMTKPSTAPCEDDSRVRKI